MHPIKTLRALTVLLTAVTAFTVSTASAANKQKPITINFTAVVGDKSFACGQSYDGVGLSKSRITPTDFRFFVSQVELIDNKGNSVPLTLKQDGVWQYQNVALLDFENGTGPCLNGNVGINKKIFGSVPKKQYKGVRFTLGVPVELNHGDVTTAPSPLNMTSLFWTWRAGYKFFKLDMATTGFPELPKLKVKGADGKPIDEEKDEAAAPKAETANVEKDNANPSMATADKDKADLETPKMGKKKKKVVGFPIHIGSTNCVSPSRTTPPTSCAQPNRVTVNFDKFDARTNVIVVDIASLLHDTNVDTHAPDSVAGCMADIKDADCKAIMANYGAPFNEQPAMPQQFLRVK